jgi:pimeloyl-ACP methyl ester carboxylesterase
LPPASSAAYAWREFSVTQGIGTASTIVLASGIKLHYTEVRSNGPHTLILLHGFTDSWSSFRLVMPLLAAAGRVIALDLRGHGASSAPSVDYGIPEFADDVGEFMERLGLTTVTLVGHSMGGFVARRIALDYPEWVDRLVVVSGAVSANNAVIRGLQHELSGFGDSIPPQFVEQFQESCVYRRELVPEWFFRSCVETSERTPPHVWRAALEGLLAENHAERLQTLRKPTLVIGGCEDAVFSVAEQEALSKLMTNSAPETRLRLYRYAGHSPHWEEPARFAQDLADFLQAHDEHT